MLAIIGASALLTVCVTVVAHVSVSEECDQAMRAAAAEPDLDRADPLIARTLNACSSVDEWLAALERHPAAMGLNHRAEIGDVDVLAACRPSDRDTPVCRDAADRGIIP